MYCMIILLSIVNIQATIPLGRIQNANWVLNGSLVNNVFIIVSNITCEQCLCRMFKSNNLIVSIACQQKPMTCQLLFSNATAQLRTDETSIVYFPTIPKFLQATKVQQLTTMSTSQQATTAAAVSNLLINPGGELGSLSPWIPSSQSAPTLDKGTSNGANIHPHSGLYDFYGDSGGGSLTQRVFLAEIFSTEKLDSNSLHAFISFWEMSTPDTITDTAQVDLFFLSATNSILGNVTTGPKNYTTNWYQVTANWSLPINTRNIDYVMKFIDNTGPHADARIDDNTLIIA